MAADRLQMAEEALEDLKQAGDFRAAEKAWTSFLVAAGAFYSKLDQGAKGHGKSSVWFGLKKEQRRNDPVLRYLLFARNSNEHGIERVTEWKDAGWADVPFGQQHKTFIQRIDPDTSEPIGEPMRAFLYSQHLVAVTAWDRRYGTSCEPPRDGVGPDRDGAHPPDIAEVALEKLRDILEEAAQFA